MTGLNGSNLPQRRSREFGPLKDERKPTPFLQTSFNETQARFSPDGRCRSPPVPPPEKAITGLSLLTASASRQLPRPKPRTSRPNVGDPQHGGGGRRKRLLAPELAAGISRLKSAKTQGIRTESLTQYYATLKCGPNRTWDCDIAAKPKASRRTVEGVD